MDVREREVVMHEGDPADKFCILLEGMVSIQKSPGPGQPRKEIAVVKAGEYLGEIGFLNNQPRTASCVAKTKVKVRRHPGPAAVFRRSSLLYALAHHFASQCNDVLHLLPIALCRGFAATISRSG